MADVSKLLKLEGKNGVAPTSECILYIECYPMGGLPADLFAGVLPCVSEACQGKSPVSAWPEGKL